MNQIIGIIVGSATVIMAFAVVLFFYNHFAKYQ